MEKRREIITVIVTYNGMKWINHCLCNLRQSTVLTQVMVIDNNSSDGTPDFIEKNFPEIILIRKKQNLGFGQANNIGIRYALENDADFVLLLNQDAYIDKYAIENMLKVATEEAIYSPLHLTGDGMRLDTMFKYSLYLDKDSDIFSDMLVGNNIKSAYDIPEVCAACWFLPIALIKKIGGFNKIFFHYGEDNNYTDRVKYHHMKVKIIPSAFMCHDRELQGNINAFNRKYLRRNILLVVCNINKSSSKILRGLLKILQDSYLIDLPNHKYKIGSFLKELCWLVWNINKIRQSRKIDSTLGKNWL